MDLPPNLPPNRLFCSHSRCFQSISEYPFRDDGLRLMNCIYCQFRQKQKSPQKQKSQQKQSQQDSLEQNSSRYCSSCNQLRHSSQFGQFKTCEICRAINKKALRQRRRKILLYNQPNCTPLAEAHLQSWQQNLGENEIRATKYKCSTYTRQPLTIDDYLQEEEPEKLEEQCLEQQLQWKQKQEQWKQARQQKQEQEKKTREDAMRWMEQMLQE